MTNDVETQNPWKPITTVHDSPSDRWERTIHRGVGETWAVGIAEDQYEHRETPTPSRIGHFLYFGTGASVPAEVPELKWDNLLSAFAQAIQGALAASNSGSPVLFAREVYQIPGVESVYFKVGPDATIHLWTIVNDDDFNLREQIYDAEARLYDLYPIERFDFYVVTKSRLTQKPLKEVIPDDFSIVPRQVADAFRPVVPTTG